MKKILLFLVFICLTLFIFTSPALAQECVSLYQSCDESHICCNFPTNVCEGGYCKPNNLHCGGIPQSQNPYCCPSPNPPCASGLVCQEGYCVTSPTFTTTHTSTTASPQLCTGPGGEGIQTALGCIPTKDTTQFVGWLLKLSIGIGGGIAFLLIIFGAIKVLTSASNPENVKAGQEMITSALMGLLFIIFSLFLLELIGVKILNIPGFSKP